jgi:N-acetylmuramic acid 6-phosphate etherase
VSGQVTGVLGGLATEQPNPRTADMDGLTVPELLAIMNAEDLTVALAVQAALEQIGRAAHQIATSLRSGGRLIYLGAGTSGRIGLLDSVECPPTFGTDPSQVVALLAGGVGAFGAAAEGAEDSPEAAAAAVDAIGVGAHDTVVGLAASGRTPFVIAGLERAGERGAATVAVSCNLGARISAHADIAIELDTGPEVLAGSTRLKAGTAQKMVCNMLSTAAMVQTGKTYRNLMIDLRPTNAKLLDRAIRIVAEAASVSEEVAAQALSRGGNSCKVATVMLLTGVSPEEADRRLAAADGFVARAL